MIVLRLFAYLALIGIGLSVALFLVTRDRRYLKAAWQIFKFSLVLLLVLVALLAMGDIILTRIPFLPL